MTTRTKLNIASLTASGMMMLNVFSKPLHIPQSFTLFLILGIFIPLILLFRYIKQLRQEQTAAVEALPQASLPVGDPKQKIRRRLLLVMFLAVIASFAAPFWMPVTGSSLGVKGDLMAGLFTAAVVCTIFGIRIRKL